jgi:cation diffusion facilitator family transporter
VAATQRHAHGPAPGADARWLSAALALILAFMVGEVVAGLAAHSLALISDAAHMLTDAASIALVLVTARLAARPPTGGYTYGLKRTEIMSAQANGITLVLLAAWLCYTAIRRLLSPAAVAGGTVLVVALVGVAVNVAATLLIARASGHGHSGHGHSGEGPPQSLNVTGAFKHIITDLYAFTATAVAGLIIVLTGFVRADAIATLIVVVLMLHAGAGLIRDSGRIFLEAAPAGLDPAAVGAAMAARRNVRSPRACPPPPRTCWSRRARIATPCAPTWRPSWAASTASPTPPCRSTTPCSSIICPGRAGPIPRSTATTPTARRTVPPTSPKPTGRSSAAAQVLTEDYT